jgi:hypothetical protein
MDIGITGGRIILKWFEDVTGFTWQNTGPTERFL